MASMLSDSSRLHHRLITRLVLFSTVFIVMAAVSKHEVQAQCFPEASLIGGNHEDGMAVGNFGEGTLPDAIGIDQGFTTKFYNNKPSGLETLCLYGTGSGCLYNDFSYPGLFENRKSINDGPQNALGVDFNNDGFDELIWAAYSSVYQMTNVPAKGGKRAFAPPFPILDVSNSDLLNSILPADLNGDGYQDLLIGGSHRVDSKTESGVFVLMNSGFGALSADHAFYPADPNGTITGRSASTMAAGRLVGNSALDIVLANDFSSMDAGDDFGRRLIILEGDGSGGLAPARRIILPYYFSAVAVSDLNGDSLDDIVVAAISLTSGAKLGILYNDGLSFAGGAALAVWKDLPAGVYGLVPMPSLQTADVDSDGDVDIAVFRAGSISPGSDPLLLLLNQGNGIFMTEQTAIIGAEQGAFADYNGDGKLDLIVMREDWGVLVALNQCPEAGVSTSITSADVNCDGVVNSADLLAIRQPGVWNTFSQPFQRTDVDHSGYIDAGDLLAVRAPGVWLQSSGLLPADCAGAPVLPGAKMRQSSRTGGTTNSHSPS